ncbi:MAG: hypothetical protein QGI08_15265 [Paracoccaceae bacterium]|jgi:hypothetical protein|nr:hypothetical protein [Paracoccaceae bacterium]MDP7187075.1 hypothetical protein [Paracoccaceae bacterium]
MTPQDIEALFTRSDGSYGFARWGRPIAPIVFGVRDETLSIVKGALEAVVALAGHKMAETDPELGSNLMVFFFRDWKELPEVPDLDKLIPELGPLVDRLKAAGANQYRLFRFDDSGAIKAAFVFLCMDRDMAKLPAETLALQQVAQTMLLWSDRAFRTSSPLAVTEGGATILKPEIAGVIRAAYDPVMPVAAADPSHALRLSARIGL